MGSIPASATDPIASQIECGSDHQTKEQNPDRSVIPEHGVPHAPKDHKHGDGHTEPVGDGASRLHFETLPPVPDPLNPSHKSNYNSTQTRALVQFDFRS
jgi:hypothetical protein